MTRYYLRLSKTALLSACALGAVSVAQAQTAPVDSPIPNSAQSGSGAQTNVPQPNSGSPELSGAGDIIVTAQRRSEKLVNVPMSVTALSGDQVAKAGVVNLHDIGNIAAGVQINFAGCCTQPAIRGISTLTTGIGYENNVAIYVDGFYSPDNVTINSDLANIAGIEVLKGPQGTLWGRNATGGAILINTLSPSDHFTGKAAVTYGRFDDKSVGGYLSGPITQDIKFSIAGYGRRSDGYVKLLDANGAVIGDATPQRQTSVRAKLEADITSNFTATLAYNYGLSIDGRGNLFTIVGHASPLLPPSPPRAVGPFDSSTNRATQLRGATQEGTLTLHWKTGLGTLSSYTGYAHRTINLAFDFDSSYLDLVASTQTWHERTLQQSLDYNITAIDRLDLVVGATYYHDSLNIPQQIGYGGGAVTSIYTTTLKGESLAGYIDGTYHLTDKLSLSAGGRYTHEHKEGSYANFLGNGAPNGAPGANSANFHAFTPRGSIRYEFAPRTNIYASVSRGFRTGGFQPTGALTPALYTPFAPEHITAYEVGLKAQRRTFSFSVAGFYYDYSNLQVGVVAPNPNGNGTVISLVTNAKKAEVYGIDGDLTWQPVADLNIHIGAAWLHGRYKDFHNATGTGVNAVTNLNVSNQAQDWTGQQMIRAPDFTGNFGIDYTVREVFGGKLVPGANLNYTTSYITNNASLFGPAAGAALANKQRYRQSGYALLNLHLNWTDKSGHYEAGVFGNNVTNKIYRLTYSGGAFGDYASYAAPSTWGFRLGYNF